MAKFFNGEIKGEIFQLRNELDGNDPAVRKDAAKRVVNLMRSGENVQSLFSSMLRCVKTDDLELKKLVYLYLINYSTQEPEQAIMAVNTFIKDSEDNNPLVRALAVRTMCRIKLHSVAEYMVIPLKKCLHDDSPYVRKTAVFGVTKLYDVIPEAVENAQLFEDLLQSLQDENPMVVSNATAAIAEINEKRSTPIFTLNSQSITPILSATTSCTEWCQTILYDAISRYKPESADDADFLIDRLIPYLKHKNPSVVIGSFKCIFLFMPYSHKKNAEIFPQIIPPFITLVTSAEPEIQYVILRTLSLFVQKYPKSLTREIRVFFCNYNDPSYIKMEKLEIIVTICGPQNTQIVLDEFSEYCNEIDVMFVRKTIRCIGKIAIKIEASVRRCVDILIRLVAGKADYAIEESVIVLCDILRRFPGSFESTIETICGSIERLKDARARAAGIWILGEYCDVIKNVDILLDPFLDTFGDEQPYVQLQLLTAFVKVYLKNPESSKDQLQFILNEAVKDKYVPDVVNRALIYWRLLSTDQDFSKEIVFFGKDKIQYENQKFDGEVLTELIQNMGTVSGVLHVVPSDFVRKNRFVPEANDDIGFDNENLRNWNKVNLDNEKIIDMFIDFDENNLYLRIANKSNSSLSQLALAINVNKIGLVMKENPSFPDAIESGEIIEVVTPIEFDQSKAGNYDKNELQIALRTNAGNIFGMCNIPSQTQTSQTKQQVSDQLVDDLLI
ncbi:Adaptin N terminal region family protein [Histomonas meleagridis]|uniref:Adaptin N terminal region family protein n=1 Tax=Histomonas meleagridis TaxID=135588 RepID=UPI003559D744|nr:Adaptin N terminal region family protein [Histomonas meleagridis]KAH0797973.1 Adaptin N terminal region family protein [Histomonas meleagridis]